MNELLAKAETPVMVDKSSVNTKQPIAPYNQRVQGNIDQLCDVIESIHGRVNNIDLITSPIQTNKEKEPDDINGRGVEVETQLDQLFADLYSRLEKVDTMLLQIQSRISI